MPRPLALVALGGNALLRHDEAPSLDAQRRHARQAARVVARLAATRRVVVTHGNGPQVGLILRRAEAAGGAAYPLTLDAAVAQSEGEVGYVLEQALRNAMGPRVVALLTQVLVSRRDPAFRAPSKPVGRVMGTRAASLERRQGRAVVRVPGGWRRAVPSPRPEGVLEADAILRLARAGYVVVAAGGGGIPVARTRRGLEGVEAVVDKDLASARLAIEVGAREMLLLTDVDAVYEGFGTPRARRLRRLGVDEARKLAEAGEFPPGTMGPKIQAALEFLQRAPRGRVVIGGLSRPVQGTILTRDGRSHG